jgi:hypothetical protein
MSLLKGFSVLALLAALVTGVSGAQSAHATAKPPAGRPSPYKGEKVSDKAKALYPAEWGIDHLKVSATNAGNLIKFTYHVVEPKLAKALGDHSNSPYLQAPRSHAILQVPQMEKIGQLRQTGNLEADKDYWMVFSNKGNLVHPGERVNVVIGKFHADGLLVE